MAFTAPKTFCSQEGGSNGIHSCKENLQLRKGPANGIHYKENLQLRKGPANGIHFFKENLQLRKGAANGIHPFKENLQVRKGASGRYSNFSTLYKQRAPADSHDFHPLRKFSRASVVLEDETIVSQRGRAQCQIRKVPNVDRLPPS